MMNTGRSVCRNVINSETQEKQIEAAALIAQLTHFSHTVAQQLALTAAKLGLGNWGSGSRRTYPLTETDVEPVRARVDIASIPATTEATGGVHGLFRNKVLQGTERSFVTRSRNYLAFRCLKRL
jgi:hypothetical protein